MTVSKMQMRIMTKCVSYVPDEAIEKDAQALLAQYAHARGVTIEAPILIVNFDTRSIAPTSSSTIEPRC
jgi:hypothetical protein